jgi:hypothetical protein
MLDDIVGVSQEQKAKVSYLQANLPELRVVVLDSAALQLITYVSG